MSKPQDHYWGAKISRTIADMRTDALTNKFSCEHRLLLNISLVNVILDKLHLMLRITGKYLQYYVQHVAWYILAQVYSEKVICPSTMKHRRAWYIA